MKTLQLSSSSHHRDLLIFRVPVFSLLLLSFVNSFPTHDESTTIFSFVDEVDITTIPSGKVANGKTTDSLDEIAITTKSEVTIFPETTVSPVIVGGRESKILPLFTQPDTGNEEIKSNEKAKHHEDEERKNETTLSKSNASEPHQTTPTVLVVVMNENQQGILNSSSPEITNRDESYQTQPLATHSPPPQSTSSEIPSPHPPTSEGPEVKESSPQLHHNHDGQTSAVVPHEESSSQKPESSSSQSPSSTTTTEVVHMISSEVSSSLSSLSSTTTELTYSSPTLSSSSTTDFPGDNHNTAEDNLILSHQPREEKVDVHPSPDEEKESRNLSSPSPSSFSPTLAFHSVSSPAPEGKEDEKVSSPSSPHRETDDGVISSTRSISLTSTTESTSSLSPSSFSSSSHPPEDSPSVTPDMRNLGTAPSSSPSSTVREEQDGGKDEESEVVPPLHPFVPSLSSTEYAYPSLHYEPSLPPQPEYHDNHNHTAESDGSSNEPSLVPSSTQESHVPSTTVLPPVFVSEHEVHEITENKVSPPFSHPDTEEIKLHEEVKGRNESSGEKEDHHESSENTNDQHLHESNSIDRHTTTTALPVVIRNRESKILPLSESPSDNSIDHTMPTGTRDCPQGQSTSSVISGDRRRREYFARVELLISILVTCFIFCCITVVVLIFFVYYRKKGTSVHLEMLAESPTQLMDHWNVKYQARRGNHLAPTTAVNGSGGNYRMRGYDISSGEDILRDEEILKVGVHPTHHLPRLHPHHPIAQKKEQHDVCTITTEVKELKCHTRF